MGIEHGKANSEFLQEAAQGGETRRPGRPPAHESLREKFEFKGKGNVFKVDSRRLFFKLLPHVSMAKMEHVVKAILNFAGIHYKKHIPSRKILSRMIVEMKNLSTYQAVELMATSKHRGFTHDGTTGPNSKMLTTAVLGEGKNRSDLPQVLTLG